MEKSRLKSIKCYCKDAEEITGTMDCGVVYSLKHVTGDPLSVYRLYLEGEKFSLEITPTKGLSVRDFSYNGRQFFWDSPLNNLPDPLEIDMEAEVIINGKPEKGTRWLQYFASHIEMLGLDNWGVPVEKNGRVFGLHGNASSIPVEEITLEEKKDCIVVSGYFYIYDPNKIFPDNGDSIPYFRVEKQIEVSIKKPALIIKDKISNVGSVSRFPDWGYHVQLKPEPGCKYLIPSREVEERGGSVPEAGFELWKEAEVPEIREERGVIHKGVDITECAFPDGSKGVETLLHFKDGSGIKCTIPPSPYTMSWFSCGGKNGTEFLIPGKDGQEPKKLLSKNWDGIGPELGASDLDHQGNTDFTIEQKTLEPGQSVELQIYLELLDRQETLLLSKKIEEYSIFKLDRENIV